MSVVDAKNSDAAAQFRAAFEAWYRKSGLTQLQASIKFGISQSLVNRIMSGKAAASMALAENIANEIGCDLVDMLLEGRTILNAKGGGKEN
jgi:transcriptional regulator with XRE-family HTH domain